MPLPLVMMLLLRSIPPAAWLAVSVGVLVAGRPRFRRALALAAGATGLVAGVSAAAGIAPLARAWAWPDDGPARTALWGLQAEEVVWAALPVCAACLLTAAMGLAPSAGGLAPRQPRRRSVLRDGVAAAGGLAAVWWMASAWPLLPWSMRGWSQRPFSPQAWKAEEKGYESRRGEMVRSLLRQRLVAGRTRTEVVALLGAPDAAVRLAPREGGAASYVEYTLGAYSGLAIDVDGLWVYFDSNGDSIGWMVVQH